MIGRSLNHFRVTASRLNNPILSGDRIFYLQIEEEADLWVADLESNGS
jgi:hypothetical protein